MQVNYIVLAIPVFLVLIGIEAAFAWWTRRDYYRLNDAVNDLSAGILDQLLGVFLKTAVFAGYLWVHAHLRLFDVPATSWLAWLGCFLGVDFLYYWFHRKSHETNAIWAAHVVHHQSEEYNLAVALRQGALQAGFSWVFYLPLALVGFPPLVFLTMSAFNTLYQFWIHTRAIGKLGPLEWVLNTPSNHRVHHARNPKYIDRNHGGTLIVWDRLFGTYAEEEEEPVYGITKPLRSWNPVWAQVHYWVELAQRALRTPRLVDGLRYLVARPGWRPEAEGGFEPPPEVSRETYRRFDVPLPRGLAVYVLLQFAPALLATWYLLYAQSRLAGALLAAGALAVTATLVCLGGLLERRPWAVPCEAARVLVLVAALPLLLEDVALAPWLGLLGAGGLLGWLWRYRHLPLAEGLVDLAAPDAASR